MRRGRRDDERQAKGDGAIETATWYGAAATGGGGDGGDGDDGRWGRRRAAGAARAAAMSREVVGEEVVVDETEFFVSAIYIGGAFSTGWSHQPVLMVVRCH